MDRQEIVKLSIDHAVKDEQVILDEFKARFEDDPLYAFEWAEAAFKAAAALDLYKRVAFLFEEHAGDAAETLKIINAYAKRMISHSLGSGSTSGAARLIGEAKIAAGWKWVSDDQYTSDFLKRSLESLAVEQAGKEA